MTTPSVPTIISIYKKTRCVVQHHMIRGQLENVNTPYDDVFRTIGHDCPRFMIPVINEVFHTAYEEDVPIENLKNEHFITGEAGERKKKITDCNYRIKGVSYQIECQSTEDKSMAVRQWEYGTQIALENRTYDKKGKLMLKLPHAAVLCLRHSRNTPDCLKVVVHFPNDQGTYRIPNIKIRDYSIDEIFARKLYYFIPFHLFVYEKDFDKYEADEVKLGELKGIYEALLERLAGLPEEEMNVYEKQMLLDMSKKVLEALARRHPRIMKGLGELMGGQILNYPAKELLMQGRREGLETGRREGLETGRREGLETGRLEGSCETLFALVADGILTTASAAPRVNITEDEFEILMKEWERKKRF